MGSPSSLFTPVLVTDSGVPMSGEPKTSASAGAVPLRPVREASLKAGRRDRHDPKVVAAKEAAERERKAAKKAKKAVDDTKKSTKKAESLAKMADATKRRRSKGVAKRLKAGTCGVRLRLKMPLRGDPGPWLVLVPTLRWFRLRNPVQRKEMQSTCWVWCSETEKWHNPHQFFSPDEQMRGARHVPRVVVVGSVPPPPRPA